MSALRGVRVLVVENDDMNAMLLDLQLKQAGAFVIGPVGKIEDALRLIETQAPDTAVLDYRLGNIATSEPVADVLAKRHIPFVLATGVASANVLNSFKNGVILTKPYLAEDLVNALTRARERQRPVDS